jgi:hypothetical protein
VTNITYLCEVDIEDDTSTDVETRMSRVAFVDRHRDNGSWYIITINVNSVLMSTSTHVFLTKFVSFKVRRARARARVCVCHHSIWHQVIFIPCTYTDSLRDSECMK